MKATIPAASNRPMILPMIALALAEKCDAFGSMVDVGDAVVVILTCMFCTGILHTNVVSHEIATYLKLTSGPTAQTLHLVQDLKATLVTAHDFDSVASHQISPSHSRYVRAIEAIVMNRENSHILAPK